MQLQITNIEPAIEEKEEGKVIEEFVNVHFVASMTPKEFAELKEQTKIWGIEVELVKEDSKK